MASGSPPPDCVSVAKKANIRSGAPSIGSPTARRVEVGTILEVNGSTAGDRLAGNDRWWRLANGEFIWSGACSAAFSRQSAPAPAGAFSASQPAIAQLTAKVPPADPIVAHGFEPDFADKLTRLLKICADAGHDFRIGQGVRPPQVQALYYCEWSKRTPEMISAEADRLANDGAPWLSALLRSLRDVKRVPAWKTSQLPGSGWHQWGEAADCYCYRGGVQVSNGSDPAYKVYAEAARKLGLTPGLYFSRPDAGHVQLRPQAGASNIFSWAEIDATMHARFGEKPKLTYDLSETDMPTFKATRAAVLNRGTPPPAFLNELVKWGRTAPDAIFSAPDDNDIYQSVEAALGPYGDLAHRRAVMLEVMRVLAGFESSWDWNAGRDTSKPASTRPETSEAGAWQVSANSMSLGPELRDLVRRRTGSLDPLEFQKHMKTDHALAMEYIARLLRRTVRANGPAMRHEIDRWLQRDAVSEFEALIQAVDAI